jgi:hypothetical protein
VDVKILYRAALKSLDGKKQEEKPRTKSTAA